MSADEVGVKKHRLYSSKADKIISKLERKCWINHEICKELSKRNAVLKKSQENHQQIIDKLVSTISQFGDKYNNLKSERGVELQELDQLVSDLVETSRSEWKKERETNEKQVMRNKRQSIIMSAPGTSLLRKSITLEPEASEINALSKLRQISDEPQQPAGKFIPLFEHFLVVGAPIEEANDVASFYQTLESQTISSRLKKTIDGIFSSPVFVGNLLQGNNSTTPSSAADVNKPNQTSSYFGFSRNRGKSLDQTASMLSSTQTVSADTELETETVGDDSNSTTVNVKSIFASPSLFLLKSRSGRESDRRVSENHEAGRANSIEQQEFENFVDFVHKQDENFPQSPAFSVNKDDHVKWDHVENGSNRCEGENEEVELKLSPKNEAKETSLAKIADNTNRSLQNFTSGFMAGSNAIKSNAGTAWSKFGGAFLSKLNPVSSSAQSPNAKSLPQPPQQPSTSTTNNEPSISGDSDLLTSYPMSTTAVPLAPTNPTEVEPEGFANKTELKETSILSKDLKTGNFIIPSSVLLRYPDNIDPPPVEVCDFCMPTGAKLHYLSSKDEDSSIQDILFGNTHSKRSGRSFVFLLEDKTVDSIAPDKSEDDKMGRLYGICVLHPRLLRTNVVDQAKKNPHKKNGKHSTADSSMSGTESVDQVNGSAGNHSSNLGVEKNVEFESLVCYAFITRFPFFDFFFQILYDIIALEKLKRIELTNDLLDTNFESSKDFYEYLPSKLLLSVLDKLSKINPETMRSNPSHKLILDEGLKPIDLCSLSPATDFTRMSDEESLHYLSDWCLTTLLSWVPPDLLVWCLSLLLQECKIIIIGHEAGLISSVVLGILTLLKPFRWVSPVIPMLPTKLLEFTEAPVPILAGVLVDPLESSKLSPQIILKRCSDMMEGVTTAVLDLSRVELNICTGTGDTFSNISLPNAFELSSSIEEKLKSSENVWNDFSSKNNVSTQQLSGPGTTTSENIVYGRSAFRPIYHPTYGHKTDVAQIQQLVQSHLHQLSEVAKDVFLKSKSDQQKLEEQLTRLSFSSQLSNIANQEADFYFSDSDSDRNHSDSSSGTDSDNEEAVRSFTPSKGAGKSLSGELRSFYEKIVQAEGSSMLKAEDAINEQTKVEEKARVLRKQLAPHSLHRLTVANIPTYNNQREFMQRFMKTQLFQDYLHENKVDG